MLSFKSLRHALLVSAASLGGIAASSAITQPAFAQEATRTYNIQAQDLNAALREFALLTGRDVLYAPEIAAGKSSPGAQGQLTERQALEAILSGSGLHVEQTSSGGYALRDPSFPTGLGAAGNAASSAGDDGEIIVTARRREENIQSVPIAITAVSQETLEHNNVQTLGDLQYLVPSLSATTGLTRDAINVGIRGQGANATTALPGVIAYLNDVPIPTDRDGNLAGGPGLLFDLRNVQVLKGPQGTLFGRNSVGGALLIETQRPQSDPGGYLQVGYGNFNNREVSGAINLPIVGDQLLARLAFNGQQRDGFTRVLSTPSHPGGVDADDRDVVGVRGSLAFQPTSWFSNDTIITYSEYDSNGSPLILGAIRPGSTAAALGALPLLAQQQALGIRTVLPSDMDIESRGEILFVNNSSTLELSDSLTFRAILGYGQSSQDIALNLDGTARPLANLPSTPRHEEFQQTSLELQLLGNSFGNRLDWIVGAFGLDSELADPSLQTGRVIGLPFDSLTRDQTDRSRAVFAQGTYDLSSWIDGLSVTGGIRETWDDRSRVSAGGNIGSVCTPPTVNCSTFTHYASESQAVTWTLGLEYQINSDTLLYLASRRGYRAGGANPPGAGGAFDPEYVTDLELGVKTDWSLGGVPIRTNFAAYYQDYDDIQVSQFDAATVTTRIANAASARLVGAELEANAHFTDDLSVSLNFDYLDFEYLEFGPGVNAATLIGGATGNRPPYKYGVAVNYRLPFAASIGDVTLIANWSWQDTSGDTSVPHTAIESFGLLNASINWSDIYGSPVDLSFYGSNLADEEYSLGGIGQYSGLGYATERFGAPLMYGVRLSYSFGSES